MKTKVDISNNFAYPVVARLFNWRPYRESNPGYLREREVS
jgi:hypothetical protein